MPYMRLMPHMRLERFSNSRDWRSFLSGAQPAAAYAGVATALKAGHAWLTGHGWTYGWLAARGSGTGITGSGWAKAD